MGLRTPFCESMGIPLPIVGAGTGSIAGPAAGLVREVLPAAEIVRRIASEADGTVARLRARGSR